MRDEETQFSFVRHRYKKMNVFNNFLNQHQNERKSVWSDRAYLPIHAYLFLEDKRAITLKWPLYQGALLSMILMDFWLL